MGSSRRFATAMVVVAAVGAATIGVTAAVADQDSQPEASAQEGALLERLDLLEPQLPDSYWAALDVSAEDALDGYIDWAATHKTALRTAETDLRSLFVDADDAEGEVADAVALVASGWLDVMHATEGFAVWSAHDLAFPNDTRDADGVATGADDLRGLAEQNFGLYVSGQDKHLDGYSALRDLGAADGTAQNRFDQRAADVEHFHRIDRPFIGYVRSQPTSVLVPLERFETQGPGVESRATSITYVCVDRDLLEEAPRPLTVEVLRALEAETGDRLDCAPVGLDDAAN